MATNSMSDEEAMLAKVAEDGNALASASDRWRNNTKVVLAVAAKRGCVPAADADTDDAYDCRRGGNKYDGWMPLKGGGEYDTDWGPGYFNAVFPLVWAASDDSPPTTSLFVNSRTLMGSRGFHNGIHGTPSVSSRVGSKLPLLWNVC